MSSKSEKKRLSDVTNAAEEAVTNQKKAKGNQSKEEHWKAISPYLEMTNKDKVEDLAKKLFQQLWKTSGEKAASEITAPFVKEIKTEMKEIHGLAGTWVTEDGGTLTLGRGIQSAKFEDECMDVWNLELQSSKSDDEWVYTSEYCELRDAHRDCDHFKAEMKIWYDPEYDIIEGQLEVGPIPSDWDCENSIEFSVKRKSASK